MGLTIHMQGNQIAAGVNDQGNVEIAAIDMNTGMTVIVEVHSLVWKETLTKLGRLSGVGIYKAGRIGIVGGTDD